MICKMGTVSHLPRTREAPPLKLIIKKLERGEPLTKAELMKAFNSRFDGRDVIEHLAEMVGDGKLIDPLLLVEARSEKELNRQLDFILSDGSLSDWQDYLFVTLEEDLQTDAYGLNEGDEA
jgi:hypothetical protein